MTIRKPSALITIVSHTIPSSMHNSGQSGDIICPDDALVQSDDVIPPDDALVQSCDVYLQVMLLANHIILYIQMTP